MPVEVRGPSGAEKRVSLAVMGVLAVVAAGVGIKQASPNPGVSEYLKAAGTATSGGALETPRATAGAAAPDGKPATLVSLPAGLAAMSAPESFDRATLSDKINGRAELYLPAGFEKLTCQRVKFADGASAWFEIFLYDMGGPRGAFSVFSTQRLDGAADLAYARHGYKTANSVCFVRGREYVEVVASETGSRTTRALDGLGRALSAAATPAKGGDLGEAGLFPSEDRVKGSVALTSANAFGFRSFDNVFTARYRDGSVTVTLFLSRRASAADAKELSASYRKFLTRLGAEEGGAGGVPEAWAADLDGSFEGVFVTGSLLGGVHEADSAERVGKWLKRLHAAVQEGAR